MQVPAYRALRAWADTLPYRRTLLDLKLRSCSLLPTLTTFVCLLCDQAWSGDASKVISEIVTVV